MLPTHRNTRYAPVLTGNAAIPFGYGLGRWRIVLGLMALTMCVCFVMLFFLPENSAIRQPIMVKTLPVNEFLLPNVPHHRDIVMQQDIHIQQDRERLDQKIHKSEDHPNGALQLDQPDSRAQNEENQPRENLHEIVNQQQVENMIRRAQNIENSDQNDGAKINHGDNENLDGEQSNGVKGQKHRENSDDGKAPSRMSRRVVDPKTQGIPQDEETLHRREKVKEVSM